MEENAVRHRRDDKAYTYSYRNTKSVGAILGNHMHIYYEFLHFIDGYAIYNVEGREYELFPGDLVFTNPNEFHFIAFPKDSKYERQFLQIDKALLTSFNPHIFDILDSRPLGENNRIGAEIFNKYQLGYIFDGVKNYSVKKNEDTDFMIMTYAAQLVIKVSEILKNEFLINDTFSRNRHIKKINQYIENNFTRHINIDEIAEYMYLNKSYISRLFKQETGLSIITYINMRRIMFAKNLLIAGGNVMDIYEKCGFENYVTFYRAFKKYTGLSPERFKNQYNI